MALILRMSYHIYYGPGVVGILVWASVFLWLYLRFRTIIPLIIVHSTWDVLAFLDQRWKAVAGLEAVLWFALLLTAFILWLVDRSGRDQPYQLAPAGWYADPAGSRQFRWFDGSARLPHTAPIPSEVNGVGARVGLK